MNKLILVAEPGKRANSGDDGNCPENVRETLHAQDCFGWSTV